MTDNQAALLLKPNKEIYIVGYPRSGNTWLARLLADILNSPLTGKFWAVPIGQEGLDRDGDYILRQLHLRPVYGHTFSEPVPDAWTYAPEIRQDERIVHIVRDPRDVAVSVYHYWEKRTILDAIKAIGGLNKGEDNAAPLGGISWQDFVQLWLDCQADIVYTSYEALHKDTAGELTRILQELEAEPVCNINNVIKRQSIDYKKAQLEQEPEKVRPYHRGIQRKTLRMGVVGDWRNHFGKEETTLAKQLFSEMMDKLEYEW